MMEPWIGGASMGIGEKIQRMRKKCDWSQEELAERIGVSRQAVGRWESGAAKPDADKIILLCSVFQISADDLLMDKPSEKSESGITDTAKRRRLTRDQISGIISLAISAVVMMILTILSVRNPVFHTHVDAAGVENHYSGLSAYIISHGLEWMVFLTMILAGVGLVLLCNEWISQTHAGSKSDSKEGERS